MNLVKIEKWPGWIVAWVCIAVMPGCSGGNNGSPETVPVSGIVTLDGQPVENATVTFVPSNGRPSTGITDSSGKYDLIYVKSQRGALSGEHTVRVSTYRNEEDAEGRTQTFPEKIPAKYNHQSELKKTVSNGTNEINLELDSKGEIIQSH